MLSLSDPNNSNIEDAMRAFVVHLTNVQHDQCYVKNNTLVCYSVIFKMRLNLPIRF